MPIRLDDEELGVFESLYEDGYPFAVILYVSGFRRRMDYATATVGVTAGSVVSEAFLGDLLYRSAKAGSHYGEKGRDRYFVRRQIGALERCGLLQALPKKKRRDPMRFFLPLAATAGLIRAQEERTINAHRERTLNGGCGKDAQAIERKEKNIGNTTCGIAEERTNKNGEERTITGYLVNKTKYITPNARSNNSASVVDFVASVDSVENGDFVYQGVVGGDGVARLPVPMGDDWMPDAAVLAGLGLCGDDPNVAWHIRMFRMYWRERGDVRRDWNDVFVWYTKNYGVKSVV